MMKNLLFIASIFMTTLAFGQIGGPDAFGYTYVTSDTIGVYDWITIDSTGTMSTTSNEDDGHEASIALGFSFPFYGNSYDTISIGSNGTVYFEDTYLGLSNNCLPGTPSYTFSSDPALIASFWDDLNPSNGGTIYYQSFSSYFVVSFIDVVEYGGSDGDSWQIVLHANGDVRLNYAETSAMSLNSGYTTGIQGSPSEGLEYICDGSGDPMHDALTVWFINPSNVGINVNHTENLIVYPNPSNGIFNVSNISSSDFEISIIDNQGRVVFNNAYNNINNNIELNLSSLASGAYILVLRTKEGITNERLIIE